MRLLPICCAWLALLCLLPAPAAADLYRWLDAAGRVHVTDDLAQVPPAQRAEAERGARRASSPASPRWNSIEIKPLVYARPPRATAAKKQRKGRVHVIAVERAGTRLSVEATLNGSVRSWFKVDTGAEVNMMPREVADALGIPVDETTPTMAVVGISGRPMRLPVIRLDEVRIGEARVRDVEMVLSDRGGPGLLGMTFFNHFRVHTDPMAGRLTLEEVSQAGVDGVHGGFGESYWRREFRSHHGQLDQVRRTRKAIPSTHVTLHGRLDVQEEALQRGLDDLHERASRGGVPQAWRE